MDSNHHKDMVLLKTCREAYREEVIIESPCHSTLDQPISLDDTNDVIDLTDDSETTAFQQLDSILYNTSNNELQFPTHLFVNIAAEWVDDLPHNIDGLKLYKIKCSPREWAQKGQNLRYFKMHSLRRKDLIGKREVGRCVGNLNFSYDDCPF